MYQQSFTLGDGTEVSFREETGTDLESVWALYSSLKGDSREKLPPFNRVLVERWSKSLPEMTFTPILAVVMEEGAERVIGHAKLVHDLSPSTKHRAELGF